MVDMTDYAARRDELNRSEMRDRIERRIQSDGVLEVFEGVQLMRIGIVAEDVLGDAKPSVCFMAQGAKEVRLGESVFRYDPERFLLATMEVPVRSVVMTASEERPYLGLRVEIDPALVGSVMVESGVVPPPSTSDVKALSVSRVDSELLDAAARLVRLIDAPGSAKALVAQTRREIVYCLLVGPEGHRLARLPVQSGHTHQIAKALERLRKDFDKPLSMEELAREMGMSTTRFHHHFKAVTDMSPLQFQKQIRLQEARRLMVGDELDASSAGYRVGYDDPSHFSRDYKKLFGIPPASDAERLRTLVSVG